MAIGQDLLNVPMGDMIRQMAFAIADAQFQLDRSSTFAAQMMSGTDITYTDDNGDTITIPAVHVQFGGESLSMMELGFVPTFYQFIDTIIEVRISITMQRVSEVNQKIHSHSLNFRPYGWIFGANTIVSTTTVDGSYASKYNYTAEGSSLLRTKLAPIPPPAILNERIQLLMAEGPTQQVVPDVTGKTLEEAQTILNEFNIAYTTTGTTTAPNTVQSQNPAAGTVINAGTSVTLTFPT